MGIGTTLYREVNYGLRSLVDDIDLGEIGLPELQRPFVWKNAKVRDLFDSMYRGYPVGFLLFWATDVDTSKIRKIGDEKKQKTPRLLVVDGQQRLTSLFAVIKGVTVVRETGEKEKIQIAFCPKTQKFEVWDAAVGRDPEFIPDISKVWSKEIGKSKFVKEFLQKLKTSRTVSEDEEEAISDAIDRLYNLENFPFYALELSSSVDEEQVAEVFVRINSQGKPLNQADFILTLMSVFWDDGRRSLEDFCISCRKIDSDSKATPFNYIFQPGPDDLLRVTVGLGFSRGRLKYGYSILRGKDLDTGDVSVERREKQFAVLRDAQKQVLDLTNWHEFLKVPTAAGFLSEAMVSSQVGMLFAYTLYLIGLKDFSIDRIALRDACAKWLFMSAMTGRYTGSPESVIEKDIIDFRKAGTAAGFISHLNKVIESVLTEDFWNITLPDRLTSSAAVSPALNAYNAALCILNAKALFSDLPIRDLFNPYINAPRSSVEKHHLFPKNFLRSNGTTAIQETNQIANFAWIEWSENGKISDEDPKHYFPRYLAKLSSSELEKLFYWHALPEKWWEMPYAEFLIKRRKLISSVVRDGFRKIGAKG